MLWSDTGCLGMLKKKKKITPRGKHSITLMCVVITKKKNKKQNFISNRILSEQKLKTESTKESHFLINGLSPRLLLLLIN